MAYREFQNEKAYAAPEIGDLLPHTLDTLKFLNQQEERRRQQGYDLLKAHKTLTGEGKILKYVQGVNDLGQEGTRRVQNDIYNYNRITPDTQQFLDEALQLKAEGKSNEGKLADIDKRILQTAQQDKYYIPTKDVNKVGNVLNHQGEPFGREMINADQQKLINLDKNIYSDEDVLENFNAGQAAADWMNQYKTKNFGNKLEGQTGISSETQTGGLFFDKNGNPKVTDEHLEDFFNFHPKQQAYYTHLAMNDVLSDVNKLQPDDYKKMGLDPNDPNSRNQALSTLIQRPDLDPYDKRSVAQRAKDRAKSKIESLEPIKRNVDVSYKEYNPTGARYGATNRNVRIEEGFDNKEFSSPSISIVNPKNTTNPFLRLSSTGKLRMNLDNGEVVKNQLPREFILNGGLQVVPVKADGTPVNISANSPEELEKKINELPSSAFGPEGITGWKMAMRGQSINKKQVLDAAYLKRDSLMSELHDQPDDKKQAQLDGLNTILEAINSGEEFSPELLQKYVGVDMVKNELVPLDRDDTNVQQIRGMTGGMDVYSPKTQRLFKGVTDALDKRLKQRPEVEVPAVKAYQATPEGKKEFEKIKAQKPVTLKESYKVGDKDYTLDALKKMGYTEAQIKQAIANGTLK